MLLWYYILWWLLWRYGHSGHSAPRWEVTTTTAVSSLLQNLINHTLYGGVNKEGIMIIYRDLGGRGVLVHEEGRRIMIIRAKEMVCVHYWPPLNSI